LEAFRIEKYIYSQDIVWCWGLASNIKVMSAQLIVFKFSHVKGDTGLRGPLFNDQTIHNKLFIYSFILFIHQYALIDMSMIYIHSTGIMCNNTVNGTELLKADASKIIYSFQPCCVLYPLMFLTLLLSFPLFLCVDFACMTRSHENYFYFFCLAYIIIKRVDWFNY
jgi:hypothetical protein